MEKPDIESGSPRSDRAACRAGCHCAASTTHCSGASFRLLEATSMNQRILIVGALQREASLVVLYLSLVKLTYFFSGSFAH